MTKEVPIPNAPLGEKEIAAVATLRAADYEIIDTAILAHSASHWLKVARVVIHVEDELLGRFPDISHRFYAERLKQLVQAGLLESQGNLNHMRFSEVRIPPTRHSKPSGQS